MFQKERLEIAESLVTTELERDALQYIDKVAGGEYKFNSFAEDKEYDSQTEKIDLANSYESLLTHESQPITEAEDYIPAIAAELQFNDDIIINSFNIVEEARRNDICGGGKLQGFAAGAVYSGVLLEQEANGRISTQDEIADAAGVATLTLRNNFKEILDGYHNGDFQFNWKE